MGISNVVIHHRAATYTVAVQPDCLIIIHRQPIVADCIVCYIHCSSFFHKHLDFWLKYIFHTHICIKLFIMQPHSVHRMFEGLAIIAICERLPWICPMIWKRAHHRPVRHRAHRRAVKIWQYVHDLHKHANSDRCYNLNFSHFIAIEITSIATDQFVCGVV